MPAEFRTATVQFSLFFLAACLIATPFTGSGPLLAWLSRWNAGAGEWRDILVEDKTATPADLAASRIDFGEFMASLSRRDRRLAEELAMGETTSRVAKLFGISAGRVSQLRQELKLAWERFHEPAPAAAPA